MFDAYKIGARSPTDISIPVEENTAYLLKRTKQARALADYVPKTSKKVLRVSNFVTGQKNKWSDYYKIGVGQEIPDVDAFLVDMQRSIDVLRKSWDPRKTTYSVDNFGKIYLATLDIADKPLRMIEMIRKDSTTLAIVKQAAYASAMRIYAYLEKLSSKHYTVLRKHRETGEPINAPEYRSDILDTLQQCLRSMETGKYIKSIKPWFLDNKIAEKILASLSGITTAVQVAAKATAKVVKKVVKSTWFKWVLIILASALGLYLLGLLMIR